MYKVVNKAIVVEDVYDDMLKKKIERELDMIYKLKFKLMDIKVSRTKHGNIAVIFYEFEEKI